MPADDSDVQDIDTSNYRLPGLAVMKPVSTIFVLEKQPIRTLYQIYKVF